MKFDLEFSKFDFELAKFDEELLKLLIELLKFEGELLKFVDERLDGRREISTTVTFISAKAVLAKENPSVISGPLGTRLKAGHLSRYDGGYGLEGDREGSFRDHPSPVRAD
ncbi:hypothetical protein [Deinococcus saxicola]|uniref:hypothetical protein n=1 Tax=Deinococcus saxicola TaxID=249406 RepID=UPI0039EF79D4